MVRQIQNLIWHLRDACDRTKRLFSSSPKKPSNSTSSPRRNSYSVRLHRSTRSVQRNSMTAKTTFKWQSSKEGQLRREDSFKDWMFSRPLALRPIYWEISSDANTYFKMEYESGLNTDISCVPIPNSGLDRQRSQKNLGWSSTQVAEGACCLLQAHHKML